MSTLRPSAKGECVTYKQGYRAGRNWSCQRKPNGLHALELHFRSRRHFLKRRVVDRRLVRGSADDPVGTVKSLPA